MPKVSVIVPVYKAEAYLERCVDSLRGQTLSDIEIILVDDGSPDRSGAMCDAYAAADPRIRVIHQPNGGVSSARNAGLDAATGDYVIHCDPDDWVEPEMYELLYKRAVDTGAELVSCDFIREYDKESKIENQLPNDLSADNIIYEIIKDKIFGSVWNKLILRSKVLESGIRFDSKLKMFEDQCFLCLLLKHISKIEHVSKALYHYDCHTNPLSIVNGRVFDSTDSHIRRFEIYKKELPEVYNLEETYRYKRYVKLDMFARYKKYSNSQVIGIFPEINSRIISEAESFPRNEFFLKLLLLGYPRLSRMLLKLKNYIRPN